MRPVSETFFWESEIGLPKPPVNIFTLGIPVELHKLLTASIVVIITILLCWGLFSFKRFLNRITFATKYFVAFKNIIDFYKYISSKSLGISCIKLLNQFCQLLLQVLHQVLKLLPQDLLHYFKIFKYLHHRIWKFYLSSVQIDITLIHFIVLSSPCRISLVTKFTLEDLAHFIIFV